MINSIKHRLPELLSSLFILLFIYTAISKLLDIQRFQAVLSESPLIGHLAIVLSVLLPASELLTAALLFFPKTRTKGFFLSLIMMSVFTSYIAFMVVFTEKLPCSCGGVLSSMNWTEHLLFNVFFTIIAWLGYKQNKKIVSHQSAAIPLQSHC